VVDSEAATPTLTAEFFIPQLHNAANANQKEKYEADLKKEIKKLQVRGLGLDSCVLWVEGLGEWTTGSQGEEVMGGPISQVCSLTFLLLPSAAAEGPDQDMGSIQ
jgi:hypothetical protein